MKTSVIASMLMASMALAAPLDLERRARLTKTEIVTMTVYSTTTVYDDEPAPAATSSQGLFYEQPPSSTAAATTSAPVVPAPVYSSSAAPAAPAPSVPAQPQAQSSQAPAPSPAAPAPVVTSAAPVVQAQPSVAAAPSSSPAPVPAAPQPSSSPSSSAPATGSYTYTDGDITVYNGYDAKGACEVVLDDSQIFFALSYLLMGPATYNIQTGAPTNKWCGTTITVEYNGKTVTGAVQDRCAGCNGINDVDMSPAAWTALGLVPADGGRYKGNWNVVS